MKIIIAGSRKGFTQGIVDAVMKQAIKQWDIRAQDITVVSGCALGVDTYGIRWAEERGLPVMRYPADWDRHGKSAGTLRNIQMAAVADALVALWDGESPGTRHMVQEADKRGLRVYIHRYPDTKSS